jgi:hypothetical protein
MEQTGASQSSTGLWGTPTSTTFFIPSALSANGVTYVAYLFAHDAGGFGAAGTDNVITCGSYTGDGTTNYSKTISLGYEPQWIMVKRSSVTGGWFMLDTMRGWNMTDLDMYLSANSSAAETDLNLAQPNATGFAVGGTSSLNANGETYIYIAIRRPMKTPTSGASVFTPITKTGDAPEASLSEIGFQFDAVFNSTVGGTYGGNSSYSNWLSSRLTGIANPSPALQTSSTAAEATYAYTNWSGTRFSVSSGWGSTKFMWYFFRRAPGFFDVVCYTGTGSTRTVTHNLGAIPEMMIVKARANARDWIVYTAATGNTDRLILNNTDAKVANSADWDNTSPTSSVFTVGGNYVVNDLNAGMVAYLFASVAGVSKVGSYTGNGSNQTINCGFTAGARFVMIKRTDASGDWFVYDTARGIVSGNDAYLLLNSSSAEVTNTDYIDPDNSGFEISSTAPAAINANGGTFIYLAIA